MCLLDAFTCIIFHNHFFSNVKAFRLLSSEKPVLSLFSVEKKVARDYWWKYDEDVYDSDDKDEEKG